MEAQSETAGQTVDTRFMTYHLSGNDIHLRTHDGILWIPKGEEELQAKAKGLRRGDKIRATGHYVLSKTLSSTVLQIQSLERV